MEKAHQKEDFEAGKRDAHAFTVDDFVWLNGKDIKRKVAVENTKAPIFFISYLISFIISIDRTIGPHLLSHR